MDSGQGPGQRRDRLVAKQEIRQSGRRHFVVTRTRDASASCLAADRPLRPASFPLSVLHGRARHGSLPCRSSQCDSPMCSVRRMRLTHGPRPTGRYASPRRSASCCACVPASASMPRRSSPCDSPLLRYDPASACASRFLLRRRTCRGHYAALSLLRLGPATPSLAWRSLHAAHPCLGVRRTRLTHALSFGAVRLTLRRFNNAQASNVCTVQ